VARSTVSTAWFVCGPSMVGYGGFAALAFATNGR
jgi:hypothetical protein